MDTKIVEQFDCSLVSHLAKKKSRKNINFSSILIEKPIQKEMNERLKKLNFGKGDLISKSFSPWLFHQNSVPNHSP